MAVRALPHIPVRTADRAAALPPVVLAVALVPSALDLLGRVQPGLIGALALPVLAAAGVATALLLLTWLRFPRTNWLGAAALAAGVAFALRLTGAEAAPALSLLTIVALGVGGGFANPEVSRASA
jgi:hypothetical protein